MLKVDVIACLLAPIKTPRLVSSHPFHPALGPAYRPALRNTVTQLRLVNSSKAPLVQSPPSLGVASCAKKHIWLS